MTVTWNVLLPLAKQAPPEDVAQGWLGGTVFVLLAVAVFLLWRNLNKQLRKVHFEEEAAPGTGQAGSHAQDSAPQAPRSAAEPPPNREQPRRERS